MGSPQMGWGRFWPPEKVASWQHQSFRALFRLGLYPLIAGSALLAFEDGFWMPLVGVSLTVIGFGSALLFTGRLGWKQAFGKATGLVTAGPYAYSRNPVYVSTWLGLIGWALCLPHPAIIIPIVLWALLYLIAPFLEEPWLEAQFGLDYVNYKKATPRFFGL
jgi:protein-S-isoprenylcysteine O-methyltransferase Ste14